MSEARRPVTFEEQVDATVRRWHGDKETKLSLREYLGMTQEQYAHWVCTAQFLESYTTVPVTPVVEGPDASQTKETS